MEEEDNVTNISAAKSQQASSVPKKKKEGLFWKCRLFNVFFCATAVQPNTPTTKNYNLDFSSRAGFYSVKPDVAILLDFLRHEPTWLS